MQATNGSAVSSRSRGRRLIGCVVALVALSAMVMPSIASAKTPPITSSYLSLGDSLAFGYSQQLFNENFPTESPSAFEGGYANQYLGLHKPVANGIQLVNNGCPGETTDSMIGNGALATALGIPGESPCAYHKAGFPLHHEYGGVSQLENALGTIAGLKAAGKEVTTVTLNIGANDELHQIAKCKAEVKAEYEAEGKSKYGTTPEKAVEGCLNAHVEELFKHILGNIGRILTVIRDGALFGGVNYEGKIVVQGGYDPYGVVFALGEFGFGTGKELLPNSNALASLLNIHEAKLVTDEGAEAAEEGHQPFKGCYANPQPTFNPKNKLEPKRLQQYTNMANFTETGGKKYGTEGADGPDIHPTPAGYFKLAKIMKVACE